MQSPRTRTIAKIIIVAALVGGIALLFLAPTLGVGPFFVALIIALLAIQVVRLAQ